MESCDPLLASLPLFILGYHFSTVPFSFFFYPWCDFLLNQILTKFYFPIIYDSWSLQLPSTFTIVETSFMRANLLKLSIYFFKFKVNSFPCECCFIENHYCVWLIENNYSLVMVFASFRLSLILLFCFSVSICLYFSLSKFIWFGNFGISLNFFLSFLFFFSGLIDSSIGTFEVKLNP